MSKSLKRVKAALEAAGESINIMQMPNETRTAEAAAYEAGCEVDQIAKSIIFRGETSGAAVLFITAGGNRVDGNRAAELAGEPLGRADAGFVRASTGFAIGGVSPIGHITPSRVFFDRRLLDFEEVFAAAGTPHHIFCISPARLFEISGAQDADFIE